MKILFRFLLLTVTAFLIACSGGESTPSTNQPNNTEVVAAETQNTTTTQSSESGESTESTESTESSEGSEGSEGSEDSQSTIEDLNAEQDPPSNIPPVSDEIADSENRPADPLGFKGVVYTDTELELFWEQSTDPSVISYHISRDGTNVTTIDALSYYDNTVEPGTTYEFTLQSVNADGVRSAPVSLFLTTPEKMPTINATNAESILDHVITATNSILFGKEIARAEAMAMNISEYDFSLVASEPDDFFTSKYDCDINGQITSTNNGNALPSYDIYLDNCASIQFDEETVNGEVDYFRLLSKYVYNSGIYTDIIYESLTSTKQADVRRELSGMYGSFDGPGAHWVFTQYDEPLVDDQNQFVLDENGEVKNTEKPFIYTSAAFEGQTRLQIEKIIRYRGIFASADSTELSNDWRHRLTAEFSIQSPATGNKTINVTTPVEFFSDQEGKCFATGQMKLSADDGSELILNAQTDSNDTLSITVIADGIRTENILPWSEHARNLHLTPDAVERFYRSDLTDVPAAQDCSTPSQKRKTPAIAGVSLNFY